MRYGRHVLAATLGASLTLGGLGMGVAPVAPVAHAQEIGAGALAVVDVDFLNVRQTPSLSGAIVTTLAFGVQVEVVTGPVNADGYDWYRLQQGGSIIGWSVAGFLQAGDGQVSTPVVDWLYGASVTVTVDALNVRATPSTSAAVLDVYVFGRVATVTGDATTADGIVWYPVDNLGWVAGQYLTGGGTPGETDGGTGVAPGGAWVYGDSVVVTVQALNVRTTPSITSEILDVYPFGTQATVTGDATTGGGITWYPLDNLGWVSGAFLAEGDGSGAPADGGGPAPTTFVYGNVVRVDIDLLNVRSLPTMTAEILEVYPSGTEATITGDPRPADGTTWYAVDNLGWVDGQFLAFVSATAGSPSGSEAGSGSASGSAAPSGAVRPGSSVPSTTAGPSDEAEPSAGDAPSDEAVPSDDDAGTDEDAPADEAPPSDQADATSDEDTSSGDSARPSASASERPSASGSAAPAAEGDAFADGDTVTVNAARLNLRAEASATAEVVEVVASGAEFTVSGDPVEVDGAIWYNVGTDDEPAWVVGTFLSPAEEE